MTRADRVDLDRSVELAGGAPRVRVVEDVVDFFRDRIDLAALEVDLHRFDATLLEIVAQRGGGEACSADHAVLLREGARRGRRDRACRTGDEDRLVLQL